MTNGLPMPAPICCPNGGSGDLGPLLLAVAALLAGHVVINEIKRRKEKPEMKNLKNILIVVAVVVAAGLAFALKHKQTSPAEPAPARALAVASVPATLPRLLELGADRCVPCKMMAPILEELRQEHPGRLQVDFIDVWKNPDAGETHGVRVIPLQIFFDAEGRELFRHEGFFAKADILAKWNELGVDLQPKEAP